LVAMAYSYSAPKKREQFEPSFQKLDEKYCVSYGDKSAPLKIVEFFSFQCPYCVRLFREDFPHIKSLIDRGEVFFQFHPVPQDLATIQAMICFEKLKEVERRLFLEALFEESVPSDPELMTKLMIAAMNVLNKPIPELSDSSFIQEHPIVETVYQFLKQEKILAVPSLEVNGTLFPEEIPSYQFINSLKQG